MQIRWGKIPKARQLARFGNELSREAQLRLQWMTHSLTQGRNATFTCRHFGIRRQTFYRWWRRYDPHNLSTLESRSHRPHQLRRPTWSAEQADRVLALRRQYPRWGKDKLRRLLDRQGQPLSTSMIGRILAEGKRRGVLVEPPRPAALTRQRRRLRHRPWATRKPRFWPLRKPGDLVALDTKQIRPARGVLLHHFSARDVVSRWDVLQVHAKATALDAAQFLDALLARMPFPVAALQVDGGSEFAAEFEQACQERKLPLFVLPPRSPKLNGSVERAHRTHNEEFYEVTPERWTLPELNRQLLAWEKTYNTGRPHQALGYATPLEFLQRWKKSTRKVHKCH
jgi:transposase InsO family protein